MALGCSLEVELSTQTCPGAHGLEELGKRAVMDGTGKKRRRIVKRRSEESKAQDIATASRTNEGTIARPVQRLEEERVGKHTSQTSRIPRDRPIPIGRR